MNSAVVIGAGVGGLCAGARLASAGLDVTVVERLPHVGGRWSTREVDGFLLPTGAFLIAMDDPLADTFEELGIEFPVRAIEERTVYLVDGELVGTGERGGLRSLVTAASDADGSDAEAVMSAIRGALSGEVPASSEPLPDWLAQVGAGSQVVGALHALTQAFMALNAEEVTAEAFFDYLRATAGRGRHGIPPQGSVQLAENLASHVEACGGRVLRGRKVDQLLERDGRVAGALLVDGEKLEADVVVSNIGLNETRSLLSTEQAESLPAPPPSELVPAPGMVTFVASREPYYDHPAVVVTGTRAICLVTTPTLVAPELAPDGWHYTETISTYRSSLDASEPKVERERHFADMDDLLPGWRDDARLLKTSMYRGPWPVYRSWPGHDPQERFPLPGLALVGDAVKPHGWPGTGASAESARIVVEQLLGSQGA